MQNFFNNFREAVNRSNPAINQAARETTQAVKSSVGAAADAAWQTSPFGLIGRGIDALFKAGANLGGNNAQVTQSGAAPSAQRRDQSIQQRLDSRKEDRRIQTNDTKDAEEQTAQGVIQPGAAAYDTDSDTIYYTYKPGDTFGQVLVDLGLVSDRGLWGQGGDVDFYTQQLLSQNVMDRYGNIPIGTTIRLQRRK